MSNSPVKTFAMQLLRAALAAVTVVLYSRWMGAEGRGELSLMLFYVNLAMIANEYVGGSSLANLVPRYGASSLQPTATLWTFLIILVAAGGYFLAGFRDNTLVLMTTYTGILGLLTIHYNLYQGLGQVFRRNRIQLYLEVLKFLLFLVLMFLGMVYNAMGILLQPIMVLNTLAISTLLVYLLSSWWLRKDVPRPSLRQRVRIVPDLFRLGFWAQNGQLVQFLNYRLSLLLIEHFTGIKATGVYANVLLLADTIWIFGNSFGTIAHMRMLRSENPRFRADITLRYALIAFAGTGLACLMMALLPTGVYTSIFGPDFSDLKPAALAFIPAILSLGLSTVFSHYLHASNRFKTLLATNFSGLVVQTLLSLWLTPIWGIRGAALAAGAGFFTILMFVWLAFRRDHPNARIHGAFRLRVLWRVVLGMFR